MSQQAEKGATRVCLTKLKKVIETLTTWKGHNHYFEAGKPVCMVAMHYQLPFMISKCLLSVQNAGLRIKFNCYAAGVAATPPLSKCAGV